jgi:C_GCAxxG_C_C family probable redox protein
VFVPYAEKLGIDGETAGRVASGFGSGMQTGGTCGVVSGAFMALGLKFGENKQAAYAKTAEFMEHFLKHNPSITCPDLLGADVRTEEGKIKIKSESLRENVCSKLVTDACEILEEMGV